MGKSDARSCKAIEVRGFVIGMAITTQIGITQIVGEDEDDVGALGVAFLGKYDLIP